MNYFPHKQNPSMYKEIAVKAVKNLLKACKTNTKYVYYNILKSLKTIETISSLDELKNVKYIGPNMYEKLKAEITKIKGKNSQFANLSLNYSKPQIASSLNGNQSALLMEECKEIMNDMNKLSSNLSEMEEKYLLENQKQAENKSTEIHSFEVPSIQIDLPDKINEDKVDQEQPQNETVDFFIDDTSLDIDEYIQNNFIENTELSDHKIGDDETNKLSCINNDTIIEPTASNSDFSLLSENLSDLNLSNGGKKTKIDEEKDKYSKSNIICISSDSSNCPANTSIQKHTHEFKNKKVENKRISTKLNYIPAYRSAAYAILKVLSFCRDGLHKNILVQKASQFTDAEFDRTKKFSAFNSFKTLIKKELIYLEEAKYYLSKEGIDLCNKMAFTGDDSAILDTKLYLIIDSRERSRGRDFIFFQQQLINIEHQTRQLEVGDFIWVKNERVLDLIIERKQANDFIQSVNDGRLKEQKRRMESFKNCRIFYVLENSRNIEGCTLNREICKLKMENIVVIEVENAAATVKFIKQLDSCIRSKINHVTVKNSPLFTVSDLCGYGTFIEEAGKGKNLTAFDIFYASIVSIKQITHEKARAICKKYKNISNFITAINKNVNQVLNEISEMEFTEGRKIGRNQAKMIIELFS
ncbi:hypothetical protein NUSPORA_01296 [Nucleospora cyclopteri]